MTPDDWQKVKHILENAIDLPVGDREAFVGTACRGNPTLEAEVNRILLADKVASGFLSTSFFNFREAEIGEQILATDTILCGRFRILKFIGAGGMGNVYAALDLEINQQIAIKVLRSRISNDAEMISRFQSEVRAARCVTHQNVCRTFDLERHETEEASYECGPQTIIFLTMELLHGQTLADHLFAEGRLGLPECRLLATQLAEALKAAHRAGVVHCDLKPSNIFLTDSREGFRAVITDFGIAKLRPSQEIDSSPAGSSNSKPETGGGFIGTLRYMAPEQLQRKDYTAAVDWYAYGLILYEAITGKHPFEDDIPLFEATKRLSGSFPPISSVITESEPAIEQIVTRCLQTNPDDRVTNADTILDLLSQTITAQRNPPVKESDIHPGASVYAVQEYRKNPLLYKFMIIVLCGILSIGAVIFFLLQKTDTLPLTTVAVLPLQNEGDNKLDYLSLGITHALTDDLTQVSGLTVTAESIVRRSGNNSCDIQGVRRALNVDAIVCGTLTANGERVRLHLELVRTRNGTLVFSKTYERSQSDVAALQGDITRELAYQLRLNLSKSVEERLQRQYKTNAQAYHAYLQGKYALATRSVVGFQSALSYFQQAIDSDPDYAPAYAGLADCYSLMAYNRLQPAMLLLNKSEDAAKKALQIDSTLGDAYSALAKVKILRDFDWSEAEELYKRSIELNPRDAATHISYGLLLLTALGRRPEARVQLNYGLNIDRESPMAFASNSLSEYYAGEYDAAIRDAHEFSSRYPKHFIASEILAQSYLATNAPQAALDTLAAVSAQTEEERLTKTVLEGVAYARTSRRELALQSLIKVEASENRDIRLDYQLGVLYTALGNHPKALHYLRRALERHQTSIIFAKVDPLLDNLRGDLKFREMIAQIRLS